MASALPYVWTNKQGRTFFRVKRRSPARGFDLTRLPATRDPRFALAYHEALQAMKATRAAAQVDEPGKGTFAALIVEFKASTDYKGQKDVTRTDTDRYLGMFEQRFGARMVKDMRPKTVEKIRDEMADQPGKANQWVSKLRALLNFGVRREYCPTNPAAGLKKLKMGEHKPWPEHVIQAALEKGDMMDRLAIITGLCSGQRVEDCIVMSMQQHFDLANGLVSIVQEKTGKTVWIPIHPMWRKVLDATPAGTSTILYKRGHARKPFASPDGIQKRMRELMEEIGQRDAELGGKTAWTFHGLRKNATNYLAELGLSPHEIAAITGMSLQIVQLYTRDVANKRIAMNIAERVTSGAYF